MTRNDEQGGVSVRLVRLERQQSRVADDVRAALASLGRGSTVIGGIALIGVGSVTERPIEAVVLLPHGVIIVIGVDLPDPALRLEAPLGGPWKADGWPLVADDDAINPATEALDISQACERKIASLVPGTAPVGTIVAVGPYVETVDQPAADLAGPVRVLHPTPTTMLAATVSLATAHRPRSVDQVRALIRGLAPEAPEFSDEILLGEGFSRFTDDAPPESLWDTAPPVPAQASAVAAESPEGVTGSAGAAAAGGGSPASASAAASSPAAASAAAGASAPAGDSIATSSAATGPDRAQPHAPAESSTAPSSTPTGPNPAQPRTPAEDSTPTSSAATDADSPASGSPATSSPTAASTAAGPSAPAEGSAAISPAATDADSPASGSPATASNAAAPSAAGARTPAEDSATTSSAAVGSDSRPTDSPAISSTSPTSSAEASANSAVTDPSAPSPTLAPGSGRQAEAPMAAEAAPGEDHASPLADAGPTEVLPAPARPRFPGAVVPSPFPRVASETEPSDTEPTQPPLPSPRPLPSQPGPKTPPEAATSRTVRWLPVGAIGLLVALGVSAVVVASSGDDTAATTTAPATSSVASPPPTSSATPVRSLEFTLRAADHDQRCASHAFGDAQASLQQTSCSGVRRASYAAIVDGRAAAVSVGIVEFPDSGQANNFKAVVDTPGGGGILDLATETGKWDAVPRFENAAYTSKVDGTAVRVVQAVWVPGPSTSDDPGLARAAKAALDLPAQ
nr:hypothetical protein [Amycolatopsis australiensis]